MDGDPPDPDLLRSLASALSDAGPGRERLAPLGLTDRALLLHIARDIAHATERQNAPLVSYLIGRFVQMNVSAGVTEREALAHAAAIVASFAGTPGD
jgi:hypothetical protein